jgi:hypothetical protein
LVVGLKYKLRWRRIKNGELLLLYSRDVLY